MLAVGFWLFLGKVSYTVPQFLQFMYTYNKAAYTWSMWWSDTYRTNS